MSFRDAILGKPVATSESQKEELTVWTGGGPDRPGRDRAALLPDHRRIDRSEAGSSVFLVSADSGGLSEWRGRIQCYERQFRGAGSAVGCGRAAARLCPECCSGDFRWDRSCSFGNSRVAGAHAWSMCCGVADARSICGVFENPVWLLCCRCRRSWAV